MKKIRLDQYMRIPPWARKSIDPEHPKHYPGHNGKIETYTDSGAPQDCPFVLKCKNLILRKMGDEKQKWIEVEIIDNRKDPDAVFRSNVRVWTTRKTAFSSNT